MNAPRVLVTGFEPFDGDGINPSREIARALHGSEIAGHRVLGAVLPTEFARAPAALEALIDRHEPTLVLALGLAASRGGLGLERVTLNWIDARIPDNAGAQPVDVPVHAGAPAAYFASLPLKAMLARLQAAGIAATLSHSAGTFVCNQVFFALAHRIATRTPQLRGGFVHVPCIPAQAAQYAGAVPMELATMIESVRLCVETALTVPAELHFAAGAID